MTAARPVAPGADEHVGELVRQDRVHRRVYTDPDLFEREMSAVFGRAWTYLAHESELAETNDFKTGYLGRRPIILTRSSDGELRALFNRCMHRGATICREPSGNARSFRCPYHGWTYANTGALTGVAFQGGYGPAFDRDELALREVPRVASYRGFVFGTVDEEAEPLEAYLGHAREYLDAWLDRYPSGQVAVHSGAHRMVCKANWKLIYDNGTDGYHPAFSHRSLLAMARRFGDAKDMQYFGRSPDESEMYVQYLGNGHSFLDQRPNYPTTGSYWEQSRPQPGREAAEATLRERLGDASPGMLDLAIGAQMNINIFPNLLIIGNQIQVIEPQAVDATMLTWYATTVPELPDDVNALRMRSQEDFPAFGEPDDLANFEECQRGLGIPEIEWVLANRGLGIPDRQRTDERGVVTAPVSDELPMRSYFRYWAELLDTAGDGGGA